MQKTEEGTGAEGMADLPMVIDKNSEFKGPYKEVCAVRPSNYSYYSKYDIQWGDLSHYEIHQKLGRGKYSEVY